MKILYAIQGTGNGHLCRALEIYPYLLKWGQVDVLISGKQSEMEFSFPVKYRFEGMGFVFGKNGGIDVLKTYVKSHFKRFIKEMESLPVEKYDVIISDFEPISAWAAILKGRKAIALSNQAALQINKEELPHSPDFVGRLILKYYAPCQTMFGFGFRPKAPKIFSPIIRAEIRKLKVENRGHYTVYLPAYSDKRILKVLGKITEVQWHVFSKTAKNPVEINRVWIRPISSEAFINSMANAEGVLSAAGFGTCSEALFLNKKLLVIPQKNQFEQECNAQELKSMGVPMIKSLKPKHIDKLKDWIQSEQFIKVDYPDQTQSMVNFIMENEFDLNDNYTDYLLNQQFSTQL